MACSPFASTEETTNANRASRLLLEPCTYELRHVLRCFVNPAMLTSIILQTRKAGNSFPLFKLQRDLVLPKSGTYTGNYDDMDISLLYKLLRNICGLPAPLKGWESDPDPTDRSVSANIERIHLARNKCGHPMGPILSNADFKDIWSTLRSAVQDLDNAFNNSLIKEVDFLRHETMDPIQDQHYREELRKQYEEDLKTEEMVIKLEKKVEENTAQIKETGKIVKEMNEKVEENTVQIIETGNIVQEMSDDIKSLKLSPIPPNVKAQHNIQLRELKDKEFLYQETHIFPSVMEKVKTQQYVTFVGVSGSGKSATAIHIAFKLAEQGYEVVPIKDIRSIETYCDTLNPQVFFIDDVVGVYGLQQTKLDLLKEYEQNITNPYMRSSKTLMTCREIVFNEALSYKPLFTKRENVITMHDSENALDENDKKLILQKYGLDVGLLSPLSLASASRMFPVLCKLYSGEAKFRRFGSNFFVSPIPCILERFDEMQRQKKLDYASLVICMLL